MMIVKKTSTVEFYRVEFSEKRDAKGHKDIGLFTYDFNTISNIQPFTDDFKTIFEYIRVKISNPNSIREQIIRNKKHRMWIDDIDDRYIKAFVSKESQNGALINKDSLEIKLAQDDSLDVELASISHFLIDQKHHLLALETFDGSTTKTGLSEYINSILEDTNCKVTLFAVPRDDIKQILNDVKEVIKFKARYRDIKEVFPDFLETHIFSSSTEIKRAKENRLYETVLDIRFGEGESISTKDSLIQRFLKSFSFQKPLDEEEKDNIIDERITLRTIQGNEEIIKLGNNIFIDKMQILLDETIATREDYSRHIYQNILERIGELIKRKKWED